MRFEGGCGKGIGPGGLHCPGSVDGRADVIQPEECLQLQLPLPADEQKQGGT